MALAPSPPTTRPVSAQMLAVFFRGLSEPSRLALVEELSRGERRVNDLVAVTGLSQSNVSKQLGCLWDCGLVERERRGREIHYRLVAGLVELMRGAEAVLEETGSRVMSCPRFGHLAVDTAT
jgi:ArsR family transcriptional regulator, cadmium/lead-responsive transcriptional repressor